MNVIFHHPCDKNRNRIRIDYILNGNMCETPKHSEKLLACLLVYQLMTYIRRRKKINTNNMMKQATNINNNNNQ